MKDKNEVLSTICQCAIVAIIRTNSPRDLIGVSEALHAGGITAIEITMTVPGAVDAIREAAAHFANTDVVFGAGTVLDRSAADEVIDAGAQFVVAPSVRVEMIHRCAERNILVMPGALTPTEILTAWDAGADVVKIFPAGVGGPSYIKDLKGPFPQIKMMATGGVNEETAPQFIKAGACAVGAGSQLVSQLLIDEGRLDIITANAKRLVAAVQSTRG